jgi:hypothetical protein
VGSLSDSPLLIAGVVGLVQGLIIWGGLRVEMRYMRRDVDQAVSRLDAFEQRGLNELSAARTADFNALQARRHE